MHNEKQKAKSAVAPAAPDWPRLTVLRVNTHQHTQQHLFRFLSFFPADATRETVTFSSPVCPGAPTPMVWQCWLWGGTTVRRRQTNGEWLLFPVALRFHLGVWVCVSLPARGHMGTISFSLAFMWLQFSLTLNAEAIRWWTFFFNINTAQLPAGQTVHTDDVCKRVPELWMGILTHFFWQKVNEMMTFSDG